MISCLGSTPCLVARREMLNIFLLFMLSSLLTCEAITCTRRCSHCILPHAEYFNRAQLFNGTHPTCGLKAEDLCYRSCPSRMLPRSLLTQKEDLACLGLCPGGWAGRFPAPSATGGWWCDRCDPLQPPHRQQPRSSLCPRHRYMAEGLARPAGD